MLRRGKREERRAQNASRMRIEAVVKYENGVRRGRAGCADELICADFQSGIVDFISGHMRD